MNLANLLALGVDITRCGGIEDVDIPAGIVGLVRMVVFIIQVVVPLLLVIWGMLDFAKSIIQSDEEKIKAGQKKFIQRLIAAIIVFLIVTVVRLVITAVGSVAGDDGTNAGSAWQCADEIIRGQVSSSSSGRGGGTSYLQTK